MLTLSVVVVLAPILQALSEYNWNISLLVTPEYSPPKVDFSMRFVGVRFEGEDLYATFELTNLGEVRVVLESLNATAYGPDGATIAPATLVHGVSLEPGAAEAVLIRLSLNEAAFNMLASYIIEVDRVNLEVKGTVVVGVFSSRATMPIKASFPINRADLVDGEMGLADALSLNRRVNIIGVVGALLLFYIALSNKPWWMLVGGPDEGRAFALHLRSRDSWQAGDNSNNTLSEPCGEA